MENKIKWETEMKVALTRAQAEKNTFYSISTTRIESAANRWMRLRIHRAR